MSWKRIPCAPASRSMSADIRRWRHRRRSGRSQPQIPSDVPFFHWSDIDPDGTWIFRTIERTLERELTPHLMSVEIAERYGRSPVDRVRPTLEAATSAIAELMAYLQREDAKWLEQEELDPMIPACKDGASIGQDRKSA